MPSLAIGVPLLWSSLLHSLLIPIFLLPACCNAGNSAGKQKEPVGIAQVIELKQENPSIISRFTVAHPYEIEKSADQIIKDVREKYEKINEHPWAEMTQNMKDENSMKEVINILEQMDKEWKKNTNGQLFECALIAAIAFNRFMQIFLEARTQEIEHEKTVANQHHALDRLKSFRHNSSFKQRCVDKIMAIFTLVDYHETNLLKKVDLTIGNVENAIKFYELKYQGSELKDLMALAKQKEQMDIFKKWLKKNQNEIEKMHKDYLASGVQNYTAKEIIGNNIFESLINKNDSLFVILHETITIKKGHVILYTIVKDGEPVNELMGEKNLNEMREENVNETEDEILNELERENFSEMRKKNLKILIIYYVNPLAMVELREIVVKWHEMEEEIKGNENSYNICQKDKMFMENAGLNIADYPAIKEMCEYFKQMPKEWKAMLTRLFENALLAKIALNRFLAMYDEYVDLNKKKANYQELKNDLVKKMLTIFALFYNPHGNNLEHQLLLTIQNLQNAIKFYEFLREMYNLELEKIRLEIEKIKQKKFKRSKMKDEEILRKEMEKERNMVKEKNEMEKEEDRMASFKTWLEEKVNKIVEPGEKSDEEMLRIGKEILKSLIATIREFEAENVKRLKHHFGENAEWEATKIGGDESAGSSHQHQHDHHLMEHAHQQTKNVDGDDKGKQPAE